jgi:hypothetical protein
MRRSGLLLIAISISISFLTLFASTPASTVQFVFTSDSHFGLTKKTFRGTENVSAADVNASLVAAINALPSTALPNDGGIGGGSAVGPIDFVANAGDIANRAETTDAGQIQPASASWSQFQRIYVDGIHVRDRSGRAAPVFAVPGNHDVSNAVGFHRPMVPATDPSAMVGLYNLMMRPGTPLTVSTFSYPRDRVQTSRDIGGLHFLFVTVWPDSAARSWMQSDLAAVSASTPVIVVTHDQPDAEGKHFTNPVGRHDINAEDKFENLLVDDLADGPTIEAPSIKEQSAFESFLDAHPNIAAYFHGNSNWNQFYDWTGPNQTAALHVFRVDSPMKGDFSAADETKLSFQLATVDVTTGRMTVRECLWNAHRAPGEIVWGASTTVALNLRR